MSGVYGIIALSLIGAFLALVLKEIGFKGARLISAVVCVTVFFFATSGIGKIMKAVFTAADVGGVEEAAGCMMKIVGIGYVFGICSDLCREVGENGVASALQMAGRVEILLISVPFITEIIGYARELIL